MKATRYLTLCLSVLGLLFVSQKTSYGQEKVKILSYNVLYGFQKDSTANIERYKELIAEIDPDIIAYQEMNRWKQKTLEELAKSYGHPYALQSKEDGFPVALTAKSPLVNFKKVTENMWHSYIYSKVKGIHVFVIHFSPFSYQKRLEEVEVIIAQARELPSNEPILIMGDFNSLSEDDKNQYDAKRLENMKRREVEHQHIRNLNNGQLDYSVIGRLKSAGFYDSFMLHNKTFDSSVPTYKTGEGKIVSSVSGKGSRIDFLFSNEAASKMITKSIILKNSKTDIISDHYPVYVELLLPK